MSNKSKRKRTGGPLTVKKLENYWGGLQKPFDNLLDEIMFDTLTQGISAHSTLGESTGSEDPEGVEKSSV